MRAQLIAALFVGCIVEVPRAPNAPPAPVPTEDLATATIESGVDDVEVRVEGEPVTNVEVFYDQLDPYGTWYDDPSYGWVFAPAAETYVPYTNGHWKFADVGLLWVSYDPFGWATDHYGRWVFQNRWLWVPDTTWGPAWVTWRESDGYIGWAACGFAVAAYVPDLHWRFVKTRDLFAIDLHLRYVPDPRLQLATSYAILRYHRRDGDVWVAGPSESWLHSHDLVGIHRTRPTLDELGRFDATRRTDLEGRARLRKDEWDHRRDRTARVRPDLDARVRRQLEVHLQLAEEQRRISLDRQRENRERQRLFDERRRIDEQHARARSSGELYRIEEQQRALDDAQRRFDSERQRTLQDERRSAREEHQRRDVEARRVRGEQDRVRAEQTRRLEQQRALDEQRRLREKQRVREEEARRHRADRDRIRAEHERRMERQRRDDERKTERRADR